MLSNNIKSRLKIVRTCLSISQKDFAEFLNIPLDSYRKWEQGKTIPDVTNLIKIADKLCTSLDWLVGREKYMILHNCEHLDIIKKLYDAKNK